MTDSDKFPDLADAIGAILRTRACGEAVARVLDDEAVHRRVREAKGAADTRPEPRQSPDGS